jgi:hypothetical protein
VTSGAVATPFTLKIDLRCFVYDEIGLLTANIPFNSGEQIKKKPNTITSIT